ncbi:universal stress protein [Actinacidiphila rubida]|uniref:Nucleotide-binding universal stress protein, UspA family n=1 Tax=Actinacidiphila rubida TaxID=310780 RepID=A0A1H8LUI9_9ACTN|nr:universal stress protein [Actinacidiphila rubida]SEO08781.1 Nucleotide-binding universal stress protein, UspA family [Actinacidiphila rubida]
MVPPGRGDGARVVVAGLDDSDSSWRAVAYAVGLARRQEALLVLVHVLPAHPLAMLAGAAWLLAGPDLTAADRMRDRITAGLSCMVEARTLRWEFEVLPVGDPVAGIARVADGRRADTVVVGTSHALCHRFGGATGSRLIRTGRWPVVVVP